MSPQHLRIFGHLLVSTDRSFQPGRNHAVNHIGCSVTDLEGFMDWYVRYLGFQSLGKIIEFDRATDSEHGIFTIYEDSLHKGRCAFLLSDNGVGLEVFQFDHPKQEGIKEPFQFHQSGFFHLCITDPDPRGLCKKLQEAGAKIVGDPIDVYQNDQVWCLYLTDPWGNVIELLNVAFEEQALRLSGLWKE